MSSDGSETVTIAEAVAEKWRRTRAQWDSVATHDGDQFRVMTDIIDAAHAIPVLRQLSVGTSLFTLCFSTCLSTDYSHTHDLPAIELGQFNESADRSPGFAYVVRNRPRGDVIGETDVAESAISLLLAHLPADVGPVGACHHARHPRKFSGYEWRQGRPASRSASSG